MESGSEACRKKMHKRGDDQVDGQGKGFSFASMRIFGGCVPWE